MQRNHSHWVRWGLSVVFGIGLFMTVPSQVQAEEVETAIEESAVETVEEPVVEAGAAGEVTEKAAESVAETDAEPVEELSAEAEAAVPLAASMEEIQLLAALIQCEAGNQPYEGQVAVGEIVVNRMESGSYPNSIREVIYAGGQFPPATNGLVTSKIEKGIKESCLMAAQAALAGSQLVGDATHFRRAGSREGIVIGSHVFW